MQDSFTIRAKAPFRLDYTVWALRRRKTNIIDNWDGQFYKRVMLVGKRPILVCIVQKNIKAPTLTITTHHAVSDVEMSLLKKEIKRLFSLSCDLKKFYQVAAGHPKLHYLAKSFIGLKPPRFLTIFEACCNAVACQQLSLNVGIELLNRLAIHYGRKVRYEQKTYYAFPTATRIAKCAPKALQALGFSLRKANTLIQIAKTLQNKDDELQVQMSLMTNDEIAEYLKKIKGIGRWSAEYILLRGLGRINIFPGDDIGAQKNLKRYFNLTKELDYDVVMKVLQPWSPYAGFVYFHLLLDNLNRSFDKTSNILANNRTIIRQNH
ncbi:DNA-3-methyladenine glycosylase 2 [Candidatus Berkiella aquae]|uniref:DNA-3-methyladenine glycosylase II n=1 Tax=Candidatus Berkiella aquae TaxID=295108 RepID=A0A0Q9YIE7_9GAMM|nr:DNA-3-methyladenine glycosylase 2 [Candidatus Berkiella aquae]MCS5712266.1 DNA-3-methyladenine glycosylase 2 family protein [Candidatus Berkiella aquae]